MVSNEGLYVAQKWHDILMKSSTKDDVEKYSNLMGVSPVEMRIILMTGASPNILLREYVSDLDIPKSTLTSIINRLERQGYLKRIINDKDRRSFGLELGEKGIEFLEENMRYQNDIGNRILRGLTKDEQSQLISLLSKISSYMVRE